MKLQNDGTLRIVTVQENDSGTYVCLVQSVAGNATTSGTLTVQGMYNVKCLIACHRLPVAESLMVSALVGSQSEEYCIFSFLKIYSNIPTI